jgi:polyisoprenoid-binding protein YceI
LTFPAKVDMGADQVSATTEFVINRQDFGVTYPGRPDNLVQDNVVLTIELTAPRS